MRLFGCLPNEQRFWELLAEIIPTTDTHERWEENKVQRQVSGSISQTGSLWTEYLGHWSRTRNPTTLADGRQYLQVRDLQVDHDVYPDFSWIKIEESTIRLVLRETFTSPLEEYEAAVRERNRMRQEILDRWERGEITGHDLREITGLPAQEAARLDQPIPPETLEVFKKRLLLPNNQDARNFLH